MEVLMRLLVAVLLVLASACTRDPARFEYTEASVAVHAVLQAGSERATVLITRFEPRSARLQGVSGAEVRLLRGAETLRLTPTAADESGCPPSAATELATAGAIPGCYAVRVPHGIRSGERFELSIELPGGGSVRGTATIPAPPELLVPVEQARLVLDAGAPPSGAPSGVVRELGTVEVRWTPLAAGTRLEVGITAQPAASGAPPGMVCAVSAPRTASPGSVGSTRLPIFAVECLRDGAPERWSSLEARVLVTAFDTAYARYAAQVIGQESILRSHAAAGLTGAYGVFAGAAAAERRLLLVNARP
jgi:hypothetical protein